MPIITSKPLENEKQIRVRLKESLIKEIDQYCNWAKINSQNEFIASAIDYVLSKDKDWKKFKENKP